MRPHADIYPALGREGRALVYGRLVYEAEAVDPTRALPWSQLTEDEVKDTPFLLQVAGRVVQAKTDKEGYFLLDLAHPDPMPAGRFSLRAALPEAPDEAIGEAWVHVLPDAGGVPVVTSDIDLTWLVTDFHGAREKLRLLRQGASSRRAFPGMDALYRGLRQDLHHAGHSPLAFLSGSPRFFKRVLQGKLRLDSIEHDALLLKPYKAIAWRQLTDLRPDRIADALREQVAYKLGQLLQQRLSLPADTPELLLGDDSEADFIVYALYRALLERRLEAADLPKRLEGLPVPTAQHHALQEKAARAQTHVQGRASFLAVAIRKTEGPSRRDPAPWLDEARAIHHADTQALALALHDARLLSPSSLQAVEAACAPPPKG